MKKAVSVTLVLFLAIVIVFTVVNLSGVSTSVAALNDEGVNFSSNRVVSTSSGSMLYVSLGFTTGPVSYEFFLTEALDIRGKQSFVGGEINNLDVGIDERPFSSQSEGYFVTESFSTSLTPYQVFDIDTSNVSGDIRVGFVGLTGTDATLAMQVFDYNQDSWVQIDRTDAVAGAFSLAANVSVDEYESDGNIRIRVTFPSDSDLNTDNLKSLSMRSVSVGAVTNTSISAVKSKKSTGLVTLNYKNTDTKGKLWFVKATSPDEVEFVSPVYPFTAESTTREQLYHFNMNFYGDTKTQRSFTWTTLSESESVVQLVECDTLTPDWDNALIYTGYQEKYTNADKPYSHYVVVDGLKEGTRYWFRYGDGVKIWSDICVLETDDGDSQFSFLVGGDPQPEASSNDEYYSRYENFYYYCLLDFLFFY